MFQFLAPGIFSTFKIFIASESFFLSLFFLASVISSHVCTFFPHLNFFSRNNLFFLSSLLFSRDVVDRLIECAVTPCGHIDGLSDSSPYVFEAENSTKKCRAIYSQYVTYFTELILWNVYERYRSNSKKRKYSFTNFTNFCHFQFKNGDNFLTIIYKHFLWTSECYIFAAFNTTSRPGTKFWNFTTFQKVPR